MQPHKCDSICYQYGCDGGQVVDRIDDGDEPMICGSLIAILDTQGEHNWEAEAKEAQIDQTELAELLGW